MESVNNALKYIEQAKKTLKFAYQERGLYDCAHSIVEMLEKAEEELVKPK